MAAALELEIDIEEVDPLDEKDWMVWTKGGDPVGPVSATQIARGIRAGRVPSDARVQRKGDVFWSDVLAQRDVIAALKVVAPAPATKWFVWAEGGQVVGPVTASQIARGVRAGLVPSDSQVQRVGGSGWAEMLDEREIIDALKSA